PAHRLEYLHDICLVWAPAFSRIAALDCGCRELDDCVSGVLLSGTGEPDWVVSIYDRAAQDHPGSDYAGRVRYFLGYVSPGILPVELPCRVWAHCSGCVLHVL